MMEPRHERIAKIALAAGARYGLALAGGYAISAHGIGDRPSGDVDLFTNWQHRHEFPDLTASVISALETSGYKATIMMSAETFARLTVTDTAFAEYRTQPGTLADMRHRFARWRQELLAAGTS